MAIFSGLRFRGDALACLGVVSVCARAATLRSAAEVSTVLCRDERAQVSTVLCRDERAQVLWELLIRPCYRGVLQSTQTDPIGVRPVHLRASHVN